MLQNITDQQLIADLQHLTLEERRLTKQLIEQIAELDRRRLFLGLGYSSLFAYLTQSLGYSNASAQRRIDAARLMRQVPSVATKIEEGSINLSQISKLQSVCRQVQRSQGVRVNPTAKAEALTKVMNLPESQTEQLLAEKFQLPVLEPTRVRIQQDRSSRIELTLSEDEMKIVAQARCHLSHKTGGGLKETFVELARLFLKNTRLNSRGVRSARRNTSATEVFDASRLENRSHMASAKSQQGLKNPPAAKSTESIRPNPSTTTTTPAILITPNKSVTLTEPLAPAITVKVAKPIVSNMTLKPTKPILPIKTVTLRLRNQVLNSSASCVFQSPVTGRVCGSRFFLEVDHIRPRFSGGSHDRSNLRPLCKNHNIYRYEQGL